MIRSVSPHYGDGDYACHSQRDCDDESPFDHAGDLHFLPNSVLVQQGSGSGVGVSPRMVTFFHDPIENVTMRGLTLNTDPKH